MSVLLKRMNLGMCCTRIGGVALSLFLLSVGSACSPKKEPARPRPPVPVGVATVGQKSVPVQITTIGNVEPYSSVGIKSQVNGQLARVNFREGEDVRKGELLFTIDSRPFRAALKQAEAALARDTAQAKYALEQMHRYGQLVKDGIVTQDQYDQLRTNVEAYNSSIAADRAAVENAKINLDYCTISSPIEGRTGNLLVQQGNLVKANDNPVLVTINQLSPTYVTFSVPEKALVEVKKYLAGGKLKVAAEIPNDPAGPEVGVVSFLDNAVDPTTGSIKLKGTFANKSRRLWPGQFVNVVLTLTERADAVVVPTAAVQTGQQGQYVFVVSKEGVADLRPVVAGVSLKGETVIEKGVQPGETVVIDGQMRLTPGAKVEIKKPGEGAGKARDAGANDAKTPTAAPATPATGAAGSTSSGPEKTGSK